MLKNWVDGGELLSKVAPLLKKIATLLKAAGNTHPSIFKPETKTGTNIYSRLIKNNA